MEMCYDGALVMPRNFVVMNEDEMTYVEGGGIKSTVQTAIAAAIGGLIGATVKRSTVCALLATSAGAALDTALTTAIACWYINPPVATAAIVTIAGGLLGAGHMMGYW